MWKPVGSRYLSLLFDAPDRAVATLLGLARRRSELWRGRSAVARSYGETSTHPSAQGLGWPGRVDLGISLETSSLHGVIFENEAIRARISGSSGKLVSPTARLLKIGLPPTVNPEGIAPSSPGLRATSYPGKAGREMGPTPTGLWPTNPTDKGATPSELGPVSDDTQGSIPQGGTTLGFGAESLWDKTRSKSDPSFHGRENQAQPLLIP